MLLRIISCINEASNQILIKTNRRVFGDKSIPTIKVQFHYKKCFIPEVLVLYFVDMNIFEASVNGSHGWLLELISISEGSKNCRQATLLPDDFVYTLP